ncbi:MAG: biotin--[acetyl-CoA-carboxylase] ligase [Buchananella hordeovulneris]|nr:biotin--[acetyl-CoA-carboxylase] ligase [Buchananella hordeovulneris]
MSGAKLVQVEECNSTQEMAVSLYSSGELELGSAVLARRQSAGRGRRGRQWTTADSALALTVVLPAPARQTQWGLEPLRVGLAVLSACQCPELRLKWPNDVVLGLPGVGSPGPCGWGNWRKLGGILCELSQADRPGAAPQWVVAAGIGMNLGAFGGATEVQSVADAPPARPANVLTLAASLAGGASVAAGDSPAAGPLLPAGACPAGRGGEEGDAGGDGAGATAVGAGAVEPGAPAPWAISAAHAAALTGSQDLARLAATPRAELAARIVAHLEQSAGTTAQELVREYAQHCVTLGQPVRVQLCPDGSASAGDLSGTAVGIAPTGALLVETGGEVREVSAGDVTLRTGQ